MAIKPNLFETIHNEFNLLRLKSRAQSKHLLPYTTEWLLRHATANFRGMANCIIVGAQKSGSSSLFYYLNQHPQVKQTFGKEVHYFDGSISQNVDTYQKGKKWYQAHFPLKHTIKPNDVCIDASPLYLFNPLVAERINHLIPECKIIILLRDPVERAISHYFHTKKLGGEPLSISEAFKQETARLSKAIENQNYKDPAFRKYSYQARGLYWQQIKVYLKHFNRNQLLILNSENFFTDTAETLEDVFNFLEIDPNYKIKNLEPKNIGNKTKDLPCEIYQDLSEYYRIPNQQLFEGIQQKFNWQ